MKSAEGTPLSMKMFFFNPKFPCRGIGGRSMDSDRTKRLNKDLMKHMANATIHFIKHILKDMIVLLSGHLKFSKIHIDIKIT